jgi:hypothetical protein
MTKNFLFDEDTLGSGVLLFKGGEFDRLAIKPPTIFPKAENGAGKTSDCSQRATILHGRLIKFQLH